MHFRRFVKRTRKKIVTTSDKIRFVCILKRKQKSQDTVFVIGDSHSNFFSGNEMISFQKVYQFKVNNNDQIINNCNDKRKKFITFHFGPALAYNLFNYGTQSLAREKTEFLIKNRVFSRHAKVLCCFGEIDLRVHVLKRAEQYNLDYKKIIDSIIANYLKFLLFLKNNEFDVFVWGPIPSQKDSLPLDPEFPRFGSESSRNICTEYFNSKLMEICKQNNIGFASIYKYLIIGEYETNTEYIADGCHLSQKAWDFAKIELKKIGLISE